MVRGSPLLLLLVYVSLHRAGHFTEQSTQETKAAAKPKTATKKKEPIAAA